MTLNNAPNRSAQTVYIVDDHPTDLHLIQRLCGNVGLENKAFDRASKFLEHIDSSCSGCLVAAAVMPDVNGIELFEKTRSRSICLTAILVAGSADTNFCRASFRAGVFDFLEKSVSQHELISAIRAALRQNLRELAQRRIRAANWHRIQELTKRELDVAELLSRGSTLKEVGSRLQISVQSASQHRSRIFDKLEVSNEVELHQAFQDCRELLKQSGPHTKRTGWVVPGEPSSQYFRNRMDVGSV